MTTGIPRVSIGLPVYNGERYLKEAIDSLLTQTMDDFELVISDNASTDKTEDICRDYAKRDARLQYHRNSENVGGAANFRRVFELTRAPVFKWAAHDDVCAPTLLEKCLEVLDARPAVVVCYPRGAFIDENGALISSGYDGCSLRSSRPSLRVQQYLTKSDMRGRPMFGLIRRKVLEKTSLIAPYISSDQILLLQLALLGEFCEFPEPLFFCREHRERGCRQHHTFAEVAAWYDPNRRSGVHLPRWRLLVEFLRSINNCAELELRETRECYLSVIRWCRWNYLQFVKDLALAAQYLSAKTIGWPALGRRKGPGNLWTAWRL
jgi:glycosyltransferase involved in cell wall biosynthesis